MSKAQHQRIEHIALELSKGVDLPKSCIAASPNMPNLVRKQQNCCDRNTQSAATLPGDGVDLHKLSWLPSKKEDRGCAFVSPFPTPGLGNSMKQPCQGLGRRHQKASVKLSYVQGIPLWMVFKGNQTETN